MRLSDTSIKYMEGCHCAVCNLRSYTTSYADACDAAELAAEDPDLLFFEVHHNLHNGWTGKNKIPQPSETSDLLGLAKLVTNMRHRLQTLGSHPPLEDLLKPWAHVLELSACHGRQAL